MPVQDIASGLCCLAILWALVRMRFHLRKLPELPEAGASSVRPGKVCLCMPARNEAEEIGPALDSWIAQDYPDFAIVVVDDGSTDATPALLAARVAGQPRKVQSLRNDALPPGWLGKNHALHLAAHQPAALDAEWLLFADANVRATPDLLRRVFAFLEP